MFCALGTWQLYRLQWKTELISEITFGLDSTPIKYSNTLKKNYQRVVSDGRFNFEDQIYLYSLNESGKPGYDVITPYNTLKNENVLVNRGWINKDLKGNQFYGLAIGLTVTAGAFSVGDISGAVLNPAVSFGPSLMSFIDPQVIGDNVSSSDFFVYFLITGITGSVLASYLYKKIFK